MRRGELPPGARAPRRPRRGRRRPAAACRVRASARERFVLAATGGDADRSSSSRPTRGVFRAVASVRSSSRQQARRGPPRRGRARRYARRYRAGPRPRPARRPPSAPGSPPRRPARACAPGSGCRPAARRGRSRRRWWSRSRRPAATRRATTTGGACVSGASTGSDPGVGLRPRRPALCDRPELDRAGRLRRARSACTVPVAPSSKDRPSKCAGTAKVASTAESTAGAERNDSVSAHVLEGELGRRDLAFASAAAWSRIPAARRPGSRRSTASDRRPRRACARGRPRRRAPAVNSSVMRRRISHCSGLVSCASSIEDVVDAAVELVEHPGGVAPLRAGARVLSIRSSKSSAPSRAFACLDPRGRSPPRG